MSIAATFSSALSGLTAASRAADLVSNNVANALTPGYGVRRLRLAPNALGGVTVSAVDRRENLPLATEARGAEARLAGLTLRSEALGNLRDVIGPAGSGRSISDRLADFEASLVEAASQPSSPIRLSSVLESGRNLLQSLGDAGREIQRLRSDADGRIADAARRLEDGLATIDGLNDRIAVTTISGGDTSALQDLRTRAIDDISALVPIRTLDRPDGRLALLTEGGQSLLDDRPVELGFGPSPAVDASLSLGAGLSYLQINGQDFDPTTGNRMAGGEIEALFKLRDEDLVVMQAGLDALSFELASRFQSGGVDPTIAAGDPGLFTDAGAFVGPTPADGLAQRLRINPAVDPLQGGAQWRLRDGLGAVAPGPDGDASQLNALREALSEAQVPVDATLGPSAASFQTLSDRFVASAETSLARTETERIEAEAFSNTLRGRLLSLGVNTDEEMQSLILIEQAYAANARVMQVADEMMQRLLDF